VKGPSVRLFSFCEDIRRLYRFIMSLCEGGSVEGGSVEGGPADGGPVMGGSVDGFWILSSVS